MSADALWLLVQRMWKNVRKVALSSKLFHAMREHEDGAVRDIFAVGRVRPSAKQAVMPCPHPLRAVVPVECIPDLDDLRTASVCTGQGVRIRWFLSD